MKTRILIICSLFLLAILASACRKENPNPDETSEKGNPVLLADVCPYFERISYTQKQQEEIYSALREASKTHDVETELLIAIMVTESRCRSKARSNAGALGLMQLMPRTARWLGVKNPLAARDSVMGGAKYLSMMLDKFDGNLELALAAYNAGPTAVRRYRRIPPFRETRNYVKRVMTAYRKIRQLAETTEV